MNRNNTTASPAPAEKTDKSIKTVGELRDALKHSEEEEPLLFDLKEGNKTYLLKCVGVGSSGGGRITVIWLDKPEPPNNYVI